MNKIESESWKSPSYESKSSSRTNDEMEKWEADLKELLSNADSQIAINLGKHVLKIKENKIFLFRNIFNKDNNLIMNYYLNRIYFLRN